MYVWAACRIPYLNPEISEFKKTVNGRKAFRANNSDYFGSKMSGVLYHEGGNSGTCCVGGLYSRPGGGGGGGRRLLSGRRSEAEETLAFPVDPVLPRVAALSFCLVNKTVGEKDELL